MVCITLYYVFRAEGDETGRLTLPWHPDHSHEVSCDSCPFLSPISLTSPPSPRHTIHTDTHTPTRTHTRTHTHAHPHITTVSPVPIRSVMICCSPMKHCQGFTIGQCAVFDSQYGNTHFSWTLAEGISWKRMKQTWFRLKQRLWGKLKKRP